MKTFRRLNPSRHLSVSHVSSRISSHTIITCFIAFQGCNESHIRSDKARKALLAQMRWGRLQSCYRIPANVSCSCIAMIHENLFLRRDLALASCVPLKSNNKSRTIVLALKTNLYCHLLVTILAQVFSIPTCLTGYGNSVWKDRDKLCMWSRQSFRKARTCYCALQPKQSRLSGTMTLL